MRNNEVRPLCEQGFVSGARSRFEDEFEESLSDEARGCEEDGFGFGEI